MPRRNLPRAVVIALGLAITAGWVAFLPPFSDGAYAVIDGWGYGHLLETDPGRVVIHPNHPLHHLLAAGLYAPLGALGVPHAGHLANRLVSGLAATLCLFMVAALAAPRRGSVGALFAVVLGLGFGFALEAGTGETLPSGFATALIMVHYAIRRPLRLRGLGLAMWLALMTRQDALLLVPGVLWAAAGGLPRGARAKPLLILLGSSGLATFGGYTLLWWAHPADPGFVDFMLGLGERGAYTDTPLDLGTLGQHLAGLGGATLGRWSSVAWLDAALGVACLVAALAAGILLRGDAPWRRMARLVGLALALRMPFFWWFEPHNWEYQGLNVVLVVAFAARLAGGAPMRGAAAAAAGRAILVGVATLVLLVAGPSLWRLRQTRLHDGVRHAVTFAGPRCRFVIIEGRADLPLHLLGFQPLRSVNLDPAMLVDPGGAELMVFADPFTREGMLQGGPVENPTLARLLEATQHLGARPIRWQGRLLALHLRLDAPSPK